MIRYLLSRRLFLVQCVLFVLISPALLADAAPNANSSSVVPANEDLFTKIEFPVQKYTLANGLTVLLAPDNTVPLISYNTWYRVGSKYEQVGYTGMAHLFEHLMFKGTTDVSGEQYEKLLEENGARDNAFTTQDYTGFYVTLPSTKLSLVTKLEADRMVNLDLTEKKLDSERKVVEEERRMRVDNDPFGLLDQAMNLLIFKVSSYRWPVVGWMQDIQRITLAKAKKFYRTYYAPNNAVVVLAGDFRVSEAKHFIQKYYGSFKSQMIPTFHPMQEPEQDYPRNRYLSHDVQATTLAVAYRIVAANSPDSYPLDLLANILGDGRSSRLYQSLVYKRQIATDVEVYTNELQDSGTMEAIVLMKPGTNVNEARRVIKDEMANVVAKPVSAAELQKAKNQIIGDYIDSLKTISGRAQALAYNQVVLGNYAELFEHLKRYEDVTSDQVLAVAKRYLAPTKSCTVILHPSTNGN